MTCKDCLLHGHCCYGYHFLKIDSGEYVQFPSSLDVGEMCKGFKDKSRIVELPCKVGDTLYYPWVYDGTSGIAMLEVFSFGMYVQGRVLTFIEDPESDMPIPNYFREEDFGKTVFLTREEAEEALRKERENDPRRTDCIS